MLHTMPCLLHSLDMCQNILHNVWNIFHLLHFAFFNTSLDFEIGPLWCHLNLAWNLEHLDWATTWYGHNAYVCMCACVHMCAYVCMCMCAYVCICVHMCACVCALCICACAHKYTKRKTKAETEFKLEGTLREHINTQQQQLELHNCVLYYVCFLSVLFVCLIFCLLLCLMFCLIFCLFCLMFCLIFCLIFLS